MIEELIKLVKALNILRIPQRLKNIESKQIWTLKSVRSVNGLGPDDLGNVTVQSGGAVGNFVHITGDTMQGDLIFPSNGYIMTDSSGIQWRVTVDTSGHLVTTRVGNPVTGNPIAPPPFLWMTYS